MLIDIDGSKCGDVDLELAFIGKSVAHLGIESVDSLYYENVIFFKLHVIAVIFSLSDLEIECRKFDPFTGKELEHVIVEALGIDSFDALEIVIAVFVPRSILTVYEIIIKSDSVGL